MPKIVTLNVTQSLSATPNKLQQMGAFISQGATTLASGSYSLLTGASSLTALLAAPLSLSSLTWSGGTVTATAAASIPGLASGDTFITTVAGATPSGYNGTVLATVTGANTFTYPLASDPGSETVAGTYTPPNQQELIAMAGEFFSQGASQAVYVLELGAGDGASGPTALSTWITANPGVFYAYLCPRSWDNQANLKSLAQAHEAADALTYFFVTTTVANYTFYSGIKSVGWFIEAPLANATLGKFDAASPFQMWLYGTVNGPPSAASLMGPFAWRFSFGTTAWPTTGNSATLATLDAAKVNYITTGAQGGISTNCLANGCFADGNAMAYWYSVDWAQLTFNLNLSNAIINAANNGMPIDFNQNGIDTLQDVAFNTASTAVAFNLANGSVLRTDLTQAQFAANYNAGDYVDLNLINAVPFLNYVTTNPSDYAAATYKGFSCVYLPMQGIESITFNLNAVQFVG